MTSEEAYSCVSRAIDAGMPAHAYLIAGGVRGAGMELALRILEKLYAGESDAPRLLAKRIHPDVHWLVPEKKSRIISVESVREKMIDQISLKSYQGGWKAGVVVSADRLKTEAANAFLKTLEEPPPKTLFLLLTDSPESLLPTIVSRCQILDIRNGMMRSLPEPFKSKVLDVLSGVVSPSVPARMLVAGELCEVLSELKEKAEAEVDAEIEEETRSHSAQYTNDEEDALKSSRYRDYRTDFVCTLLGWARDLTAANAGGLGMPLVNDDRRAEIESRAGSLTHTRVFENIGLVEELSTAFERNIPDEPAVSSFCFQFNFGTDSKNGNV